jgi:hypothetical protein
VTGLQSRETEDTVAGLASIIKERLLPSEIECMTYEIFPIPDCDSLDTVAALVDFINGLPAFLHHLEQKPLNDCAIETKDGDVTFDRHFFGFTQLYHPDPAQPINAE